MDSLYHARRHFNKMPELYALYKESLAVLRQRPEQLRLLPPSQSRRLRQRGAGERAKDSPLVTRLEPEVRAYARAQARVSAGRGIAECQRAVKEREVADIGPGL